MGLVLPFGSRVATSRINFRLLAREAMSHGKRLDIAGFLGPHERESFATALSAALAEARAPPTSG